MSNIDSFSNTVGELVWKIDHVRGQIFDTDPQNPDPPTEYQNGDHQKTYFGVINGYGYALP